MCTPVAHLLGCGIALFHNAYLSCDANRHIHGSQVVLRWVNMDEISQNRWRIIYTFLVSHFLVAEKKTPNNLKEQKFTLVCGFHLQSPDFMEK